MATNTKKVKGLQIPFKEFMPGQLIISSQFNDDMKDIEDKVNEIIDEHNVMSEEIDAHTDNTENPHQVNAHQVGTYDSGEIDEFVNDLRNGEFNDNVIENNVLADDCIDTRNYRDASITSSKVEPSFGSQLDISENIEIRTRYTKQETDELIKTKVGDGTYTKEELDTKFEEVQAGVIIDSTIGLEKLKPNVGNELDISRNVNIRNKYTKDEVDYLIKTNALPRDWGSILEADIDESFQSKDTGVIPAADYMIADMFVSPTSTALEFDIKEVADSRNGYDSLNDRLNASDTKISSLELSVNDFKSEVEAAFLNTLEKVDTLEEISGSLDTQIKGINKQIFDNTNEVDSKIKKINTQLKQVDTSINNANTQISALTEKDANHEINLNKLGSRIDTTSSQLQQVKSDVETLKTKPSVPVEIVQQVNKNTEDNKRQDIMLSGLFNENADGRLSTEENGNDIKLESSKQGLVEVEKVVGNTLVNRVSEQMRELTLNGNIDAEGTFVTTTEGADNGLVDVMCEGNTLVNLWSGKMGASSNVLSTTSMVYTPDINKTYTLIFKKLLQHQINVSMIWNDNTTGNDYCFSSKEDSLGLIKKTIKLSTFEGKVLSNIRIYSTSSDAFTAIQDVIILEGDYTNKPIPSEYFEGMKSVGQDDENGHKIEILSQNKNLFDINDFEFGFKIDEDGEIVKSQSFDGVSTLKRMKSNAKYIYTVNHVGSESNPYNGTRIYYYDSNEKLINKEWMGIANTSNGKHLTIPNNVHWFRYCVTTNGGKSGATIESLQTAQLEEGTQATSYVPHASNKKEISLNEPLRGLPNGVKDRFVKIDGKNVVKRVLDEKTFNGSSDEGWIINPTQPTETGSTHISFRTSEIPDAYNNNGYAELLCDKFKWNTNFHTNGELIKWANHKTQNMLVIVIQKSQLTSPNVDGLKKWLQANPIKVVYQLAKPIYEPLEIAPELLCYNEVTYISNNSLIPSNMVVKNTGFSCRALTSDGTYTVVHNGGEGVTSNVDTTDNMVILSGKGKKVSDVMVLDGEVSKTYGSFEGMKSTFADKLVTQEMVDAGLEKAENLGKYKVNVTVRSKNLKNLNTVNEDWANGKFNTTISQNNQNYHSCETFDVSDLRGQIVYRGIFRNGKFFNINSYFFVCIFDKDKKQIGKRFNMNRTTGYKIPPNAHYMRFMSYIGGNNSLESVKTDKYAIATEPFVEEETYEPFKEYKTSVYLNNPLLKGDEIVCKDGQLGIIHNSKLDKVSNNVAHCHDSYYKNDSTCVLVNLYQKRKYKEIICCDNLPTYIQSSNIWSRDYLCGISTVNDFYDLAIRLPHNVTGVNGITDDIKNKFKTYLSNNDIYFIGSLVEPYFEPIVSEIPKWVSEMPNNATLHIDSIIPCQNVKVSYTSNVPSVYGLEETGITNTNDIATTQTAVDFLLMSNMGEVMMMSFNENTRGGNNMGAYFASRIMKKALKYEDIIRKYPEFKEDIDFILRSEGCGDLIVEVQ